MGNDFMGQVGVNESEDSVEIIILFVPWTVYNMYFIILKIWQNFKKEDSIRIAYVIYLNKYGFKLSYVTTAKIINTKNWNDSAWNHTFNFSSRHIST